MELRKRHGENVTGESWLLRDIWETYNILNFNQKRYFLMCENCFWMASTLPSVKDISRLRHKKCPVCVNNVNRFLICEESF
jgi:hypothetical protein